MLKDPKGLLIQPTENTQSARQMRFTDVRDIIKLETIVRAYLREAIEAERAGLKVRLKTIAESKIPAEFQDQLDRDAKLRSAFAALTPGRQRAYLLHFSAAKQSQTRTARIDKFRQQILAGKGMDDDYRAGRSKASK